MTMFVIDFIALCAARLFLFCIGVSATAAALGMSAACVNNWLGGDNDIGYNAWVMIPLLVASFAAGVFLAMRI